MAINRMDNVRLIVPDLEQGSNWYEGVLGMRAISKSAHEHHFSCGSDHAELTLVPGKTGMQSFTFGVDSDEDLEKVAKALSHEGVAHAYHEGGSRPGEGKVLAFTTPAGHNMQMCVGLDGRRAGAGSFSRSSEFAPSALDHINLLGNIDPVVMQDFWTKIGFKLAIALKVDGAQVATWLRSTRLDHDIAYMRAVRPTDRLHHIAFSVADISHLAALSDRLMTCGYKWEFGIGRHNAAGDRKSKGFGTNIFAYAQDPFGHRNEFCTDVDEFDDDAPPLISEVTGEMVPHTMNAWASNMPETYLTTGS